MTKFITAAIVVVLTACSTDEPASPRDKPNPSQLLVQEPPTVTLWSEMATAPVGGAVVLLAEVTDPAGEPVPDGTVMTFQLTGASGVLANSVAKSIKGVAKTTVIGLAPGAVTATASLEAVFSNAVTVVYREPATTGITRAPAAQTSVTVTEAGDAGVRVRVRAVDEQGKPVAGVTISLTSTAGTFSGPAVTGSDGWATVVLSVASWECPLTVTAVSSGQRIIIEILPEFVDLSIERMGNELLGVIGSGNAEAVSFKIALKNADGSLYLVPTQVKVWVEPAWLASLTWDVACCAGEVVATVHTGRSAGMASLWVEAPELGLRRSIEFLIEGGLPTAQSFSLTAERRTVSALRKSGILVNLFAAATDRWGNSTMKNRPVFTSCESGTCLSPNGGGDAFGRAMFTIDTTPNERLAIFSDPIAAEFPVPFAHHWPPLGDRRNGWLTVIAGAIGETTFADIDGDGVFSPGDGVIFDPPEPYVDRDENGTFDSGETFWDYDGDHAWSAHEQPGFHPRQYVWSSYTLVLSGRPAIYIVPDRFLDCDADLSFTPGIDFFAAGSAADASFPCAVYPPGATTTATNVFVHFADENGNQLPAGSELNVELSPRSGVAMGSNSLQATRYDGSESRPYQPVRYHITDLDTATGSLTRASFCAQVVLGDTSETFVQCIDGFTY